MRCGKRAVLYVFRKKGKTAALFLLVFVVSVFLLACFAVMQAAGQLARDLRTSLGAAFYIRAVTDVTVTENGETQVHTGDTHITQAVLDTIMGWGEIRYCNPVNYGFAKSADIRFIPGDRHSADSDMGRVTAAGWSALVPAFVEEAVTLLAGEAITPSDSGRILVSEQLAAANRLSVGDTVTLTHAELLERDGGYTDAIPIKTAFAEVTVAGIYRVNTEDTALSPTAGLACNTLYASLDVLDTLQESEAGIYTGEVGFYLTDPADLGPITRRVQQMPDLDWTAHFIRTNDFQYAKIAGQLSSLVQLLKGLLVCVSAVSAVILTLLLAMRMRGRTREVGILLSVGVSKGQIMGQLLAEVLPVAAAALLLSCPAALGVIRLAAENVFKGLQPHLLNGQTLAGGPGSAGLAAYLRLGAAQTAAILAAQLPVIVFAVCVSSAVLMRLQPKDILSKAS